MSQKNGIIGFIISLIGLSIIVFLHPFGTLYDILALVVGVIGLIFCSIQKKTEITKLAKVGSIIAWIAIIVSVVNITLALSLYLWGKKFIS